MWQLIWELIKTLSTNWKLAIVALIIIFLIGIIKPIKRFLGSVRDGIFELFSLSGITIFILLAIVTLIFLSSFGVI
jgi:hypothetical protein